MYQSTDCSPSELVTKFRKLFGTDHKSFARSLGLEADDIGSGYDDSSQSFQVVLHFNSLTMCPAAIGESFPR